MKHVFICLFGVLVAMTSAFAGPGGASGSSNDEFGPLTIIKEGKYQGKNIFVQNPFGAGGLGFCVTQVFVNGIETKDETQASDFEIDLSKLKLKLHDFLEIKIKHRADCHPKILNPNDIYERDMKKTGEMVGKGMAERMKAEIAEEGRKNQTGSSTSDKNTSSGGDSKGIK